MTSANSELLYAFIAIAGVFVASVSQVMLKKSALKSYDSITKEYCNPLVICAYVLFIGTTFISIYAYRGIPLSFGLILESTSYIFITFFGVKIFGERICKRKVISLCFIIAGISVYALLG